MQSANFRILDMGCQNEEYKYKDPSSLVIGVDNKKRKGVDVIAELETNLPFEDNVFDVVRANYILEHIFNLIPLMQDIHRVLKPSGMLWITVPHPSSYNIHMSPEHKSKNFSAFVWDYYYLPDNAGEMFKVRERRLYYTAKKATNPLMKLLGRILDPFININPLFYEKFLSGIIRCDEIYFELEAKK